MIKKWIITEFLKKYYLHYIVGIFALVSASLLALAMPKMLGYITDRLTYKDVAISEIYKLSLYMLLMGVVLFVLKFIFRYFLMGKARDLECFLRGKLFQKFQSLTPSFYNNRKTGDLMAYAINDLGAVRMAFSFGFTFIIEGFIINSISIVLMVETINPTLTLLAGIPIVISIFVILMLKSKIRFYFTRVQEAFSDLSDRIQENISGIRVVKSFVQEQMEIQKLHEASQRRIKAQMDYVKISGALAPSTQICFGLSQALVLVVGGIFVNENKISLGDFIAFNTYLALIMGPINQLGRIVEIWQKAFASMKRLDSIFMQPIDIEDSTHTISLDSFNGQIEIKDLSYSYPGTDKKVLKNVNITIKEGKTLGITGRTGSGKTTLINLLMRMYPIENGHIFIDGMDINTISLNSLRENIGYVPQDNFLFSTSIKTNIKFFNEIFTDTSVIDASKAASVYKAITSFKEGFDTITGERGVTLSGGQKQRVSMARAIIKTPGILILDDSLSAVDTETEKEILKNIRDILNNKTGIIISHRVSAITHADEIIVLDEGEIIEKGSHEELLEKHGEYFKIYQSQCLEEELGDTINEK